MSSNNSGNIGSNCTYKLTHSFKVKQDKEYPIGKRGAIFLYTDDVLTKNANGTFVKHTGVCRYGIHIPDEDIVEVTEPVHLVIA